MTVELIRPRVIAAPDTERLQGTLYDVAPPQDGLKWVDPAGMFESLNCIATRPTDPTCGSPDAKTFDPPTWVSGARFVGYAGIKCQGVGSGAPSLLADVQAVYERVESRVVESGLVENVLSEVAAGADKTPTPGTAISPSAGLAILEEYAAGRYAGAPTLHIPRGIAQYLSQNGALDTSGSMYRTNVGSKVSAGGGYGLVNKGPNNAAAGAGEFWMWVTGEVLVLRADLIAVNELNRVNNENLFLAERQFIAAIDCLVGAVLVEVP